MVAVSSLHRTETTHVTVFILGAAMFIIGVTNQSATVNGATLMWVAGIALATTAAYRRPRVQR